MTVFFGIILLQLFVITDLFLDVSAYSCTSNSKEIYQAKTICYFTDWAVYRPGKGSFVPEDIDPKLCDYIVYAFAKLDDASLDKIIPADPNADLTEQYGKGFYKKGTDLQNDYDTQVLLSVGGWNESKPKYSKMMADKELRKKVACSIVDFLVMYGFVGVDLDIEYPAAYQGEIDPAYADDKENFIKFLKEIKKQFKKAYDNEILEFIPLLTIAVSGNPKIVHAAYDVPKISKLVNWIGVMSYDMHINSESETGFPAPFVAQPGDEEVFKGFSVTEMMKLWLDEGAPYHKLVVGFPFYGPLFTLADSNKTGLKAPTLKPKTDKSTMSFYEVVDEVYENGWEVVHMPELGSYAFNCTNWVGYDDKADVALKADYIVKHEFFGGMIWALDYDYFQKGNKYGRYPLLSTIKGVFTGQINYAEVKNIT